MTPSAGRKLEPNAIVQVSPTAEPRWRLLLLVVTEVYSWGVVGYWTGIAGGHATDAQAIRITFDQIEPVGARAIWDAKGERVGAPEEQQRHHP